MKPHIVIRKFHRWLGLLIGVQVVLWLAGGLVMSFFDIDQVRGSHNSVKVQPVAIEQKVSFDSSKLIASLPFTATKIELTHWQDRLVWRASNKQQVQIVDAQSGDVLSPFNQVSAELVANRDFSGNGQLVASQLIEQSSYEIRGRELPLWQMQFDDADNTRIYVSPATGEVVARRNDTWRLFDFFWMLHIMDYQERDDFNHPLLIIAALLGLLFSLTGVYLVVKTVFLKRKLNV
ncbi:PepSY domain-containing protein [Kangiella sp. TOML190]|uniref:PepSY domain-containing protein n=1 Tax=Kangiella sp. TOML190 TaxID=2931351 RepID=UPI00203E2160|nr:PepSY domain-containing protein [Kangiella sp. TOML190]